MNIGMVVYPEYEVNITHSLFHSTEDFEKCVHCMYVRVHIGDMMIYKHNDIVVYLYRYYVSTKHEQSMVQAMEEGDDAAVKRLLSRAAEAFKAELEKQGSSSNMHIHVISRKKINSPHIYMCVWDGALTVISHFLD